jgi:hypothetical protein
MSVERSKRRAVDIKALAAEDAARALVESGQWVGSWTPDVVNEVGLTPLQIAAGNGYVACVLLLLKKGATVDQTDNYGDTALIRAALSGRWEVAQVLIEHGADVNLANKEGCTPLLKAKKMCNARE